MIEMGLFNASNTCALQRSSLGLEKWLGSVPMSKPRCPSYRFPVLGHTCPGSFSLCVPFRAFVSHTTEILPPTGSI